MDATIGAVRAAWKCGEAGSRVDDERLSLGWSSYVEVDMVRARVGVKGVN